MSINLKEAVDFLLSGGYVYWHGKTLKLHSKFYTDLAEGVAGEPPMNWIDQYTGFIILCQIPARGESRSGEAYCLNKYSDPGMRVFKRVIEGGVKLEDLVESTKLYYRSGVRLKVAIGRYMHEGLWRTDYEAYMQSKEAGTTQEHVNQQTSDGTHTAWQLG